MRTLTEQVARQWTAPELLWLPAHGLGYYPVREDDEPYRNGGAVRYWEKYVAYANTPVGEAITAARVELVRGWTTGPVLDVGIGCGAFIEALNAAGGGAYGHDVNPVALSWLCERGLWRDPGDPTVPIDSVSLFDVLEHLAEPAVLLERVRSFVFVSVPLFAGADDVLASRHFRPTEHRWYWTADGLIRWMGVQGFECVEHDERETALGREGIGTFVFRRRS